MCAPSTRIPYTTNIILHLLHICKQVWVLPFAHINKIVEKQIEVREHLEKVHRHYITERLQHTVEIFIIQNTSVSARLVNFPPVVNKNLRGNLLLDTDTYTHTHTHQLAHMKLEFRLERFNTSSRASECLRPGALLFPSREPSPYRHS